MDLKETELRRAQNDSKVVEALASALDIAITIYDRHDTLVAASPEFQRFFDADPVLLQPGARLRDLLAAVYDSGARVLGSMGGRTRNISRDDWIAERIAIHWRERYESVERLPDGRWIRLCKRRMPDGMLVSTIADVSEQKRRDIELSETRHQAELAQHILDNLANPVMVKDSELRYIIVNEAFCRIPGLHAKQVLGRTARELVEPAVARHFETIEREVLETGIPFQTTENIYRADGSVMHAVTHARRSGTPGSYFVTVSFDDVTELVKGQAFHANDTWHYDVEQPCTETSPEPKSADRILVLDADADRGASRAASLKAVGSDALAIANASEAIAFLKAARTGGVGIDFIEICDPMALLMARNPDAGQFPPLVMAIQRKLAGRVSTAFRKPNEAKATETAAPVSVAAAPEAAPAVDPHRPSPQPEAVPSGPAVPPVVPETDSAVQQEDEAGAAPGVEQPREPDVSQPVRPPARNRLRVLVAEDNDVNQIVFEQILEGIGVDYRIVDNGREAVAAWRAAPPDLILMDISMPVMNGLQAAQAIRDAEAEAPDEQAHTPIVAVTAHAMSGDRERCFAAGMDDYLSKPVSPEKLESIIRKWIDCSNTILSA